MYRFLAMWLGVSSVAAAPPGPPPIPGIARPGLPPADPIMDIPAGGPPGELGEDDAERSPPPVGPDVDVVLVAASWLNLAIFRGLSAMRCPAFLPRIRALNCLIGTNRSFNSCSTLYSPVGTWLMTTLVSGISISWPAPSDSCSIGSRIG